MAFSQPISKTEFAQLAGVALASVSKAANNALKPAIIGKRVDLTHVAAQNYLQKQRERRCSTPEFMEVWEFCMREGMPGLNDLAFMFELDEAAAKRLQEDLIAIGIEAPAHVRGTAAYLAMDD